MSAASDSTSEFSPSAWKDFLFDVMPSQGTWTEEQYLAMTDHTNRLIEFTDGRLEPLAMPTDRHQAILAFLYEAFAGFVRPRGGKVRFAPLRLQVRPCKFRGPDLLLLRLAADPRRQNRFWTGADLALEVVSQDKPSRDLIDKRGDYAEGGVPEYWIVNPENETIAILTLDGGSYVDARTLQRGQSAASMMLEGFAVDVTDVFNAD
jgi:Uma2 family endonuclease